MASDVLNLNVGVLGHIDSGKTALAKVLSTTASTAAFDKNPQSKERGITIDLGFSSFEVDFPECLRDETTANTNYLQFTLVDCPGHASLIKTIIGGAQIIDMMMLVVDVTKGMQTQTAECLVIGEITCDKMVVVLNKIDLLPADRKLSMIEKMTKKMQKTLEKTKFAKASVIPVAAKPGGPEAEEIEPVGIQDLVDNLIKQAYVPRRKSDGPLLFSVDHCFSIKGQGTVMTGTVIQGSVSVNDAIKSVLQGILDSGMNLNPQQEGTMIYLPIPKVTREHREKLVKNAKALLNKAKEDIRFIQNKYISLAKKNKSEFSEDLIYDVQEQVKLIANEYVAEGEKMMNAKQKELLGD